MGKKLTSYGQKAHFGLDVVERARPSQPCPGLPQRDSSQFQDLPRSGVVQDLHDAPTDIRLAPDLHDPPAVTPEVDMPAHPPQVDLFRERLERSCGINRHLDCG